MKKYCLYDALIQSEKTSAIVSATKTLFDFLNLTVAPLKGAKADVGSEYLGLDQLKFLERNAYTLTLAAKEECSIVCCEQSSFISLSRTKDLLLEDASLQDTVAQKLLSHNLSMNLDVEILSLEQFLMEAVGIEKLSSLVKHPFVNFSAALFRSNNFCRARKYNDPKQYEALLELIKLSLVQHESTFESDGFEIYDASARTAYSLASKAMLDMFDNAADFVVVCDARSFIMFDFYQKELEKVAGRDIGLSILSLPELLALAFGLNDKKALGLTLHKVAVFLI